MRRKKIYQKGLTLIELLVAISLFVAVSALVITVFINIIRIQGRLSLENAIYEDARFMMERISRAVRNNTVDYEEYFNKGINYKNQYGDLYGCYAAQFYNPGEGDSVSLSTKPGLLGAYCNDKTPYNGQECVVYKPSVDLNTGKFPYLGNISNKASDAFCPNALLTSSCDLSLTNSYQRDQLYLINRDGNEKTIFALKQVKNIPEYALAEVELQGEDNNNDGITEKWRGCSNNNSTFCCKNGYNCPNSMTSLEEYLSPGATFDSTNIYKGFIPISPLRTNVTNLKFSISPSDDPRKAFAKDGNAQRQPKVTISLTVQPSSLELLKYGNLTGNDIPTLTLQTTISSRIQSEVKSYLGSDTYKIGTFAPSPPASTPDAQGNYCYF